MTTVFKIRYAPHRLRYIDLQKLKENAFRRGVGKLTQYGRNEILHLLAFFQELQKFFCNFYLTLVF